MTNAELIKALWCCACVGGCTSCPLNNQNDDCWVILSLAAADALEADEKRIVDQQKQITKLSNLLDNKIEELEAQFLKEGEWKWNSSLNEYEWVDHTIYCPKCGARMRRERERFENDPVMKDIKDDRGLKPIITDGENGLLHIK